LKKTNLIILSILITFLWGVDLQKNIDLPSAQGTISMISPPVDMEKEINPEEYIIGVGDQFLIEKMQDGSMYSLPVLPSGKLIIPGTAVIKISGKTLNEALKMISEATGPYSSVSLYNVKNIRIPIAGATGNPGIYKISASWRLSDLLKRIPLSPLAKEHAIEIRDSKGVKVINIYNFYVKGDLESNPYLHSGESVFIPFADMDTECIEVNGPVRFQFTYEQLMDEAVPQSYMSTWSDKGLVPFIKGESLGDFQRRKIQMSDLTEYDYVMVIRNDKQIIVEISDINSFILEAKDKIEYVTLARVIVSGYVIHPGAFNFMPGHTVVDYISMAGGVNYKGSLNSAIVIRGNKKFRNIEKVSIKRGDIILVKRSPENILIGETSILTFISVIATIASTVITAFIAAGSLN